MTVSSAATETLYFVIIVATFTLFLISCAFAVTVVFLRRGNEKKAEYLSRLEKIWEPRLLDYLHGEVDTSHICEKVEKEDKYYFVEFLSKHARRIKGKEMERLQLLAAPFLDGIEDRTQGGDAERRARAVQTLGLLSATKYRSIIISALDDDAPLVAMTAAWAIMRNPDEEGLHAVVAHLERFDNWSPMFLAAMLQSVGNEIAPALRNAFSDASRAAWVRVACANALRDMYDLRASRTAAAVLENEYGAGQKTEEGSAEEHGMKRSDFEEAGRGTDSRDIEKERDLPAACLRLIGEVGKPEQIKFVRAFLQNEDYVLRAVAATTLGRLAMKEDHDTLRSMLEDPSPWVAVHAARALREVAGRKELEVLAESEHPRAGIARQILEEAAA